VNGEWWWVVVAVVARWWWCCGSSMAGQAQEEMRFKSGSAVLSRHRKSDGEEREATPTAARDGRER
jgi:hypothetical protein